MNLFDKTIINKSTSSASPTQRGALLIEATALLPLTIIMIFASFAVASIIQFDQRIANVAREGSQYAARECATQRSLSGQESCLNSTVVLLQSFLNQTSIENLEIILSIYEYKEISSSTKAAFSKAGEVTSVVKLRAIGGVDLELDGSGLTSRGYKSRFTPPLVSFDPTNPRKDYFEEIPVNAFPLRVMSGKPFEGGPGYQKETVVICEVFYMPKRFSIPFSFFLSSFFNRVRYEVAII